MKFVEAGRAPKAEADTKRAVDLLIFELGVANYHRWLVLSGIDPEEDAHAQKAEMLTRRYKAPILDSISRHLAPFAELPSGARLKPLLRKALRKGNITENMAGRVAFYEGFLGWSRAHMSDVADVFKKREKRVMREAIYAVDDDAPAAVISTLAAQPSVSGLTQTRRWLKQAAVICDVEVNPTQEVIADTDSAKAVAESLRDVDRKLSVADPISEEAANLALDKQDLQETLDEVVADARDSDSARANAADIAADVDLPDWVNEYGLNDEQKRVMLAEGNLLINAGAGSGKAQSLDSKILTPSGWKRMGDMRVGDKVLAHDGTPSEVVGVYPQGSKKMYRVTFHDGASTECCGEHLWRVENTRKARSERRAKILDLDTIWDQMTRYSRVQYAIPMVQELNFEGQDLPLNPYLLGVLLGDGYLGSERGTGFRFSTKDAFLVKKVRQILSGMNCTLQHHDSYDYLIQVDREHLESARSFQTVVHPLRLALEAMDLLGKRSKDKFIPNTYFWTSFEDRLNLLQGLMDTDGTVSSSGKNVTYTTVSIKLAEAVRDLVQSLGGTCVQSERQTSYTYKGEKLAGATSYRLTIKLPNNINPFSLPRKAERVLTRDKYLTQRIIKDVQYIGEKEAQCIAIDHPDHLYVTDDFIVTHNTHTLTAKIAYAVREQGYHPDQILATSFTRAASAEIKERVKERFGIESDNIGRTTHSIAGTLIRNFRPDIEKKRQNLFSGNSANVKIGTCMKMAYKQLEMESWMNRGQKYYKKSIGADDPSMAWVNQGGYPSDPLGRPIPQKTLEIIVGKMRAAGIELEDAIQQHKGSGTLSEAATAMWAAYEWLKENNNQFGPIIDFDDMLKYGHEILKTDPKARAQMQKQFKVLLIDEAQDQNIVQNEIFDMIGAKADTLAYIGDDRQSIYAFRGASPEEFVSRKQKGFEVLTMTTNYRSGQNIVQAGEDLIAHNEDRQLPKTCRAFEARGEGEIRNRVTETHEEAAASAVREIAAGVQAGESPDNYGVVVRNNAEKDAFMIALIAKGIPYRSASGSNFFKKPAVKAILTWLKVACLPEGIELDNALLTAHESPGFMLDRMFKSKVERVRGSRLDFILEGGRQEVYTGNQSWRNASVEAYGEAVKDIRDFASSASSVGDIITKILSITGNVPKEKGSDDKKDVLYWMVEKVNIQELIADSEIDPDDISMAVLEDEAKAPLSPLLAMANKMPDPDRYLAVISKLEGAMDKTQKKAKGPENANEKHEPAVQVDTCHQWKGLEANHVYVCMAAGVWPNYRSEAAYTAGDETAFDEERRLAYVAITRGRDSVTVLSPDVSYMGKDAGTSRFVSEACIKDEKIEDTTVKTSSEVMPNDTSEAEFMDEFEMDTTREISDNPLGDLIYEAFINGEIK